MAPSKQLDKSSSTFCILPFIHINAAVSGHLRPCCNTRVHFPFTDNEISLKDAFHSKEMDELRRQLSNNEKPDMCKVCWDNEAIGMKSQRIQSNKKFKDKDVLKLSYLDMKFDNKCNLQCRMCSPYSSNLIWKTVEQFDELPNHLSYLDMDKKTYDANNNSEKRKQYVIDALPDLTYLKVTGGEPFISDDFLNVLDIAVSSGYSKNITLSITTNGTKFNKKIIEMFRHFKHININISIDGVDEVYNYIRYPYDYKLWKERVNSFISLMSSMEYSLQFSTVVTAYNYLNLPNINDELLNLKKKSHISFNYDLKPEYSEMHAKYLPRHILEYSFLDSQVKFSYAHRDTEIKREELLKTTLAFDKIRNQSYEVLHPLLVNWLQGVDSNHHI